MCSFSVLYCRRKSNPNRFLDVWFEDKSMCSESFEFRQKSKSIPCVWKRSLRSSSATIQLRKRYSNNSNKSTCSNCGWNRNSNRRPRPCRDWCSNDDENLWRRRQLLQHGQTLAISIWRRSDSGEGVYQHLCRWRKPWRLLQCKVYISRFISFLNLPDWVSEWSWLQEHP